MFIVLYVTALYVSCALIVGFHKDRIEQAWRVGKTIITTNIAPLARSTLDMASCCPRAGGNRMMSQHYDGQRR